LISTSYKVATVWGIPIKLHLSLLIIVFYFIHVTHSLVFGILLEIGLATSIILHELGHSLVAIKKGCRVREITLMCIGGAAQMEKIPTKPWDECLMAAAGPLVSLVLGLVLWFGATLPPFNLLGDQAILGLQLLGVINLWLVAFNMLPSFPMDGGRILRAALTPKLGRLKATFFAARLGKIMAIGFGFYGFMHDPKLWLLIAVAYFVYIAAGNEYRMVEMQENIKAQGGWSIFGHPASPVDDRVNISPPPYQSGRDQESRLEADEKIQ
jgi:Zn-dependent protease